MKHALPIVVLSLLAIAHIEGALAQPVVAAVVNGASYGAALAPGCVGVIFGTGLAQSQSSAPSVPWPFTLGGHPRWRRRTTSGAACQATTPELYTTRRRVPRPYKR